MEDSEKKEIIKEILLTIQRLQKELNSVSVPDKFFGSITTIYKLNIDELKKILSELWDKNIQRSLDKISSSINHLKEQYADLAEVYSKYQKSKRDLKTLRASTHLSFHDKIQKYKEIYNEVVGTLNTLTDSKQELISKGRSKYWKIYLLTISVITIFYGIIVSLISQWDPQKLYSNIWLIIIIWAIILRIIYVKLYTMIHRY